MVVKKESEIFIDAESPTSAAVALVEDGKLVEFHIEHADDERIIGNIYKGVVVNVLPGMEAAFINIGLTRNAFLNVSDVGLAGAAAEGHIPEKIELRQGDTIMVQVTKEEEVTWFKIW